MTDTVNVPRETTREMWAAGGTAACNMQHQHHDAIVEAVWRAMLAAAPKAEPLSNPQQLEDQTEAQKGNQAARLYAVATGANVEDVYGSEWCADPAVTFRTDLASILSHPAPSSELLGAMTAAIIKIAQIAVAWGWGAGEPASEIAGGIVSYLAANPAEIESFLQNPSYEQSIAACRAENGCLTWRAMTGEIMDRETYAQRIAKHKGPQS